MTLAVDKFYVGNNLPIIRSLPDSCVDLVYLDPPILTPKMDIRENRGEYLSALRFRFTEIRRVLKSTGGVIYHFDLRGCWRVRDLTRVWLDSVFGAHHFQAELVWQKISTPNECSLLWAYSLDHIVMYSKGPTYSCRPEVVSVDEKNNVKPVGKSKVYPSQKPLRLMRTLIKATTRKHDVVLDPFAGSGTTLIAAQQLGRRFIGIDSNVKAKRIWRQRTRDARFRK